VVWEDGGGDSASYPIIYFAEALPPETGRRRSLLNLARLSRKGIAFPHIRRLSLQNQNPGRPNYRQLS
jgi:hypothetical protein